MSPESSPFGSAPSEATQEQYWNDWNTRLRSEVRDDAQRRAEKALELFGSLALEGRPRMLEIGCSTGFLCSELARHGEVTGTDLSGEAVEMARQRVPDARFLAGDFLKLDFGPEPYDVIFSLETIAHVSDKQEFCRRVASLLADGGHLVITTQNARIWEWSGSLKRPPEILQALLTMDELKQRLDEQFRVLSSGTIIPYGHGGLLRLVNSPRLNRPIEKVLGETRVRRAKEALGLGNTIWALARKRGPAPRTDSLHRHPELPRIGSTSPAGRREVSQAWTRHDIPDQRGRVAIVTGANSGIGLETVRELARQGAQAVLACRSPEKAQGAIDDIRSELPDARVEFLPLDLADLDSVRGFASAFRERFQRLDLLINNAGVMAPPAGRTRQGFELQLGVNHLAHFALTGLLLDRLLTTADARVVNVSSQAHRWGRVDFDDLDFDTRGYNAAFAYAQSKIANLLFTFELARRSEAAGVGLVVAAAHPGWTQTNLQQHSALFQLANPFFGMRPAGGALPTLRAATAAGVKSGDYYGPGGFYEMRGAPKQVDSSRATKSREDAERLWKVSEQRTGVHFDFASPSASLD